jgi:hypothetical protein
MWDISESAMAEKGQKPEAIDLLLQSLKDQLGFVRDKQEKFDTDSRSLQMTVNDIQNGLNWHFRIGSGIATAFVAFFVYFALHILPTDIDNAGNKARMDTQAQFSSMETEIAVLSAKFDLRQTDAPQKLPEDIKKRASGQGAVLKKNLKIIAALADQATADRIVSSPVMMSGAGRTVLTLAVDRPEGTPESWEAVSALINYQAFMFARLYELDGVFKDTKPCVENPPALVQGGDRPQKVPGTNSVYQFRPTVYSNVYRC